MDDATQTTVKQALALAQSGKFEDSIDLLYSVSKRECEYDIIFVLIGEIHLMNNDPKRAIRPLEIALELNQDNYRTHFLLGNAYGRILRFEDAIEELVIADEMNPNDDEIIRHLGWIHCMAGHLEDGRRFLKKAMRINPKNSLIYNDMAASFMFTIHRDLKKAETWLRKALSIEPKHPFINQTYQAFVAMKENLKEISR
ncbi:hypothetical protein JXJ21_14610 [candidate division KSB1 bacterium]|nr:hypothetical protein [candidate division KSB1 bacterium]